MPERLRITRQAQEGLIHVRLAGVIDEDSALEGASGEVQPGQLVVIDTAEVTRINSCGVRDWVNWLARLEAQGARVVLVDCSVHIVDQINMVHNFIGSGQVKSFFAPYYCEVCDKELLQLFEVAEIVDPLVIHPPCPSCGRATELDHLPEQYFAFLEDRPPLHLGPDASRAIARLSKGLSVKMRELDGGPRQAAAVELPAATPPVQLPPVPAALPQAPYPPPLRRAQPLREQTGPHPSVPRGDAVSPARRPELVGVRLSTTELPPEEDEVRGTAKIVQRPKEEPPRPVAAERLTPLATALAVAGIVLVLALMFLLVFRSW